MTDAEALDAWQGLNSSLHRLFDSYAQKYKDNSRPCGYLALICTDSEISQGKSLISEFHNEYGHDTSCELLCDIWLAKMRKPVDRPHYSSEKGSKQLLDEMKQQKHHPEYDLNTDRIRNLALSTMQDNPGDFCDFINTCPEGTLAAAEALEMSPHNIQQAALLSRIAELSIGNEWGDNLTLIALCRAANVGVRLYKLSSDGKNAIMHPSKFSVPASEPDYIRAHLLHTDDGTHWNAALPLTDAHRRGVTDGVLLDVDGHDNLVVFGTPRDGHCQFRSFAGSLSKQGIDVTLLIPKDDSMVEDQPTCTSSQDKGTRSSEQSEFISGDWQSVSEDVLNALYARTDTKNGGTRTTTFWRSSGTTQTVCGQSVNFYSAFICVKSGMVQSAYFTGMKVRSAHDETITGILIAIYYGSSVCGRSYWFCIGLPDGKYEQVSLKISNPAFLPAEPVQLLSDSKWASVNENTNLLDLLSVKHALHIDLRSPARVTLSGRRKRKAPSKLTFSPLKQSPKTPSTTRKGTRTSRTSRPSTSVATSDQSKLLKVQTELKQAKAKLTKKIQRLTNKLENSEAKYKEQIRRLTLENNDLKVKNRNLSNELSSLKQTTSRGPDFQETIKNCESILNLANRINRPTATTSSGPNIEISVLQSVADIMFKNR